MKTTHSSSLSLVAILASLSLSSALADSTDDALNQFYTENTMSHLGSDVPGGTIERESPSQPAEKNHKPEKGHKRSPVPSHSTQTSGSLFSYRSSPAVTNKAYASFLTAVSANNPANRTIFQKELATNPESRFDARFSQYGYSSHNLADSLAGLIIVLWEISNNQDASAHPAGIQQVRVQVGGLLTPKKAITSLPNASKQYLSEYVKLLAAIYSDAWKKQRSLNNVAGIQNVQNIVQQSSQKLGIDFKRLQLTDSGFKKI
jgi:hypothetical protein